MTSSIILLHSIKRNKIIRMYLKKAKTMRLKKKIADRILLEKEVGNFYYAEHLKAYANINSKTLEIKKNTRRYLITLPPNFCLYENPIEVMKLIKTVASLSSFSNIKELYIDHTKCKKHDLAAEILFASAVRSLDADKPNSFRIEGILPSDEKMSRLLKSIGVVKDTAAPKFHEQNYEHLKLYKKCSDPNEKNEKSLFELDRKTAATTGFADYLNECLGLISTSLSGDEKSKLTRYLGEVLGNAEDHSGGKIWQIVGYLDSSDLDNLCCEIVIFNIGKTFFETFIDKKESAIVNDKRLAYVNQHDLPEELLTLVYAMQQNASSKLDEQIDRGQGTKYFMELFHHLTEKNTNCHSKPKMLILSGGAILKMDGTYNPILSENKLIYALNKSNDLSKAPDGRYIEALGKEKFPGAIIYIRYSLQELEKQNDM